MKNKARRIRAPKILRKPEIETGDRETLKTLMEKLLTNNVGRLKNTATYLQLSLNLKTQDFQLK